MRAVCMRLLAVGLTIAPIEVALAQSVQLSPSPTATLANSARLVAANEVAITNDVGREIQFHIRPLGGEWTTYTVSPGSTKRIWCERCLELFEVATEIGGKVLKHQLKPGSRYSVLHMLRR